MLLHIKPNTLSGREYDFYTAIVLTKNGPKRPHQPMKGKSKTRSNNCFKICDLYNDTKIDSNVFKAALEPLMETTDAARSTKAHFFVEWGIKTGIFEVVG